jgi:hypothetical protein
MVPQGHGHRRRTLVGPAYAGPVILTVAKDVAGDRRWWMTLVPGGTPLDEIQRDPAYVRFVSGVRIFWAGWLGGVLVGVLCIVLAAADVRIGRAGGILFVAGWFLGVLGWFRMFWAGWQLGRRYDLPVGTMRSRAVVRSAYRDARRWR